MYTKTEQLLLHSSYKDIPGILCIDQGNPGPAVAIFGVTHGNEIAGFNALVQLIDKYNLLTRKINGKVFLITHNIKAYQGYREAVDKRSIGPTEFRFLDINLNRIYNKESFDHPELQSCYEIQRAKQIAKIVPELDATLDLHSTSKPSDPFLLSSYEKEDIAIADKLFFYRHIYNLLDYIPGTTLTTYANLHGKVKGKTISIGVECGSHFEESSLYCAEMTSVRFLSALGSIEGYKEQNTTDFKMSKYKVVGNILPQFEDFSWKDDWKSFQLLPKGTVLATENGKAHVFDKDYILIMPTANPIVGGDGVYLAESL